MSRPFSPRSSGFSGPFVRVNGKIRAREVRVVGHDGKQLGVLALGEAINLARAQGVDLVEIAPNATPPVCRLVDYGKYRYEQSKKEKEAKKHHHANKVKEVQLSPTIDPHDFGVKLTHAIDFLCDEMKVKLSLRFRGREMAHQEIGFQVVKKFIQALILYGHPDADVVTPGDFYIADWVKVKAIRGYRHFSGTYQIVAVELTQSGPRAPIVTKLTVIPNQNAVTLGTPGIEET